METKKSNRANLEKNRTVFFQAGLLFALGIAFVAFEWQSAPRISDVVWERLLPDNDITIVIPVTTPELPPPPPPLPNLTLEIVDIPVDIGDLPDFFFNAEVGTNILPTDIFSQRSLIEDEPDIFDTFSLEEQALFDGKPAEEAFRNFISQNLKYPQIAIDHGITGRVFVQFVVDQRGNVVDMQVVRGIDPLLDNEALRLIKTTSGRWTPGMQAGRPVKVRYTFPIIFQLRVQ